MSPRRHNARRTGLRTSPWIILGSTVILLAVVIVMAVQNTHREKRYMSDVLLAKGAALIRAVEAGARTGMMGMRWGGRQIQQLLEETARLPDVLYIAVVNEDGATVAHSDPTRIDAPFRKEGKLIHLGPELQENWELVDLDDGRRAFEVHRHFRPLTPDRSRGFGHMSRMMQRHMMISPEPDDWFGRANRQALIIVVGLDVDPFEEAIREDIRTSVVMTVILLLLGFAGFVSIFWMQSYRTTKRSLQDTSAFADEVVTHLPVGLIATGRDGRISFFNAAAEEIIGVSADTAAGRLPDELLPAGLCGLKELLEQGRPVIEKEMTCAFGAGGGVPVSVSATRIVNEVGEFVGDVLILRDLGEVRRLQEAVRRQEKLAAVGGLAAGVAHEIRNPLSSIKGMATYFGQQFEQGSEAREAADVMIQEVDRLNRAITELLEFARPSDLKLQSTPLAPLLTRSIQLIQQDAANLEVQVDLEVAENLCPLRIDPDRIIQCLLNLYLNALQAMEAGGRLAVACHPTENGQVAIAVSDTGPGISADRLNQIFDPYFTTKQKGTGLGLAIVYKIVEAHQGRLEVESTPDRGTTFRLLLPCPPPGEPEVSP